MIDLWGQGRIELEAVPPGRGPPGGLQPPEAQPGSPRRPLGAAQGAAAAEAAQQAGWADRPGMPWRRAGPRGSRWSFFDLPAIVWRATAPFGTAPARCMALACGSYLVFSFSRSLLGRLGLVVAGGLVLNKLQNWIEFAQAKVEI